MFSIDADIRPPGHGGRRAVVSDRDAGQREALSRHLAGRGFRVSQADNGLDALSIIGEEAPSVALLHDDQGGDGERALALAAMLYPQTRIIVTRIVVAGAAGMDDAPDGEEPFPVLRRPVDLDQLDRCLDALQA
ncbi:CheY-like chemotaxis protein [Azospirillum agricola]|uniref:response regulator n=1 Tax=Azospirillum agricola TaxID=1720247 RepID=UPI001AE90A12|nr:response regulator [Azospirillum agricola]MBP2228355.1 CheY-like chemotaxis protein [Azospirillum agricola]